MPEQVLSPVEQQPAVIISPHEENPIISKGFDDPVFLAAAEKAFSDRSKLQIAQPKEPGNPLTQAAIDKVAEDSALVPMEPKIDRPPTPRKASEWASFHDAKVKVEKERDELKSRLDQFKDFDPKEYDTIKTERTKLSEKLDAIALERSDRFQTYFNDQKDSIASMIKSAMGDKADKVAKLLELPDSDWRTEQLEALSEELTPLRRARLERACADMDKLNIERSKVIEKSAENWKALQDAQKQEASAHQTKMTGIFEEEIKSLSDPKNGIAPFQEVEGNTDWNKGIKSRVELARKIFKGEISPQERASHAAWAASVPDILKSIMAVSKENEAMKSELEKLRVSEPGLEHADGKPSAESSKEYEGMSMGEAVARIVEKAGGFAGR